MKDVPDSTQPEPEATQPARRTRTRTRAAAGAKADPPAAAPKPRRRRAATAASSEAPAAPAADGGGTPVIPLRPIVPAEGATPGEASAEADAPAPGDVPGSAIGAEADDSGAAPSPVDAPSAEVNVETPSAAGAETPDIPRAPAAGTPTAQARRTGRFKERALQAARVKFANDPLRNPLNVKQLDEILDLLHQPGKDRTLVSSTWTYLERGMSYGHAGVTIDKLRGTFRGDERRAA